MDGQEGVSMKVNNNIPSSECAMILVCEGPHR